MAIAIKSIPVLKGKVASEFVKKADQRFKEKGSVDYSSQAALAAKILSKAKI